MPLVCSVMGRVGEGGRGRCRIGRVPRQALKTRTLSRLKGVSFIEVSFRLDATIAL